MRVQMTSAYGELPFSRPVRCVSCFFKHFNSVAVARRLPDCLYVLEVNRNA